MNRILRLLLAVIILLYGGTSCNRNANRGGNTKQREPFYLQWWVDNGSYLSLEGPTRVLPGEEVPFILRMNNSAQVNWDGKYCLLLLNQSDTENQLLDGKFSLKPGEGQEVVLNAKIPSELVEDAYGLALVIPGSMASVTTVQIGKSTDARAKSWPEPRCIDE